MVSKKSTMRVVQQIRGVALNADVAGFQHIGTVRDCLLYTSIGSSQAKHYIDKLDRYRESYYKYHTGHQWKRVENYDLCLDSAAIGLDNCVELIKKVIELKFDGKAK